MSPEKKLTPKGNPNRIHVTLPDGVADDLHEWAKSEHNKPATLAAFIIEQTVREAKEKGLIPLPFTLESAVERLGRGEWVEDKELTTLSHDTGIHVEVLKTIRRCLTTNGGRSNVHTH